MTLELYIGHSVNMRIYFVNRHRHNTIDKDAVKFEDVKSLVNYLNINYKKRRASLKFSQEVSEDDKLKILEGIAKTKTLEMIADNY